MLKFSVNDKVRFKEEDRQHDFEMYVMGYSELPKIRMKIEQFPDKNKIIPPQSVKKVDCQWWVNGSPRTNSYDENILEKIEEHS